MGFRGQHNGDKQLHSADAGPSKQKRSHLEHHGKWAEIACVTGVSRQYPKIRENKKWKFSFFCQRQALSTSFNIFVVTYSVTNFLPKLVDMLLFSVKKNWISFFPFPYFSVLPLNRPPPPGKTPQLRRGFECHFSRPTLFKLKHPPTTVTFSQRGGGCQCDSLKSRSNWHPQVNPLELCVCKDQLELRLACHVSSGEPVQHLCCHCRHVPRCMRDAHPTSAPSPTCQK